MEQFLEIACVGLRTVVDEDLIDVEMDTTRKKVVLQNRLAKEVVALFWAVATEPLSGSHLIGSLVHSLNDSGCQRLRHITNAE